MKLTITKIKNETPDAISLIFEKPKDFFYYPGQYLDIKLPVEDLYGGNTRAFTISSSPTEDFLMITFKKGISVFKKYLENLKVGDEIETSHPAGTFTLDETEPAVFIAGGIGITPVRSILKNSLDTNLQTSIHLIYSNSNQNYVFENELTTFQNKLPNLQITYLNSSLNGRIEPGKIQKILNSEFLTLNSIFYLSGSQRFITDIKKHLIELGVEEFNIRTDSFDGY